MPDGTRQIDEIRAEIWEEYLQPPGDWFRRQTHQLLTAAAATPLRGLFPYTSHNTLHFSRCSYYPVHARLPMDLVRLRTAVRHLRTASRGPPGQPGASTAAGTAGDGRPGRRHSRRGACASAAGAGHLGR
ncbi:DUF6193 family natural product biosynthesis protein [Polymorphospora rubra]|uniref:DUF6193 family natural product biosynthesis protein n=1 Tax=Polymorphospora rubra TaxID=338584 RepID=UPI0033D2D6F0